MAARTRKTTKPRITCTCPSCDRYAAPAGKLIAYCHETHDLGAYYDGILIGCFRTHLAAETALDEYKYQLIEDGLIPTAAELADDAAEVEAAMSDERFAIAEYDNNAEWELREQMADMYWAA